METSLRVLRPILILDLLLQDSLFLLLGELLASSEFLQRLVEHGRLMLLLILSYLNRLVSLGAGQSALA